MKCEYCQKEFKRESSLLKHLCEPKRRYLNKDSKVGQLAFELFSMFKKHHHLKSKKDPLIEFLTSKHYRAFETLAEYFLKIKPLDIKGYFSHLMCLNVPFRKWTSDDMYSEWVRQYILTEDADLAVCRSIETLSEYAKEKRINLNEVCSSLSGNRLCLWIKTGRISPWFLLLSSNNDKLLEKFDTEMLDSIESLINPLYWRMKIQKSAKASLLKKSLQAAGI